MEKKSDIACMKQYVMGTRDWDAFQLILRRMRQVQYARTQGAATCKR